MNREQKVKEEQEKLKEQRLRMRESNKTSNVANLSDTGDEVTQQLEALDRWDVRSRHKLVDVQAGVMPGQ